MQLVFNQDVSNPDLGLNFLAGYHFDTGFAFNISYGFGLANLSNSTADGSIKNQAIGLSISFFFK